MPTDHRSTGVPAAGHLPANPDHWRLLPTPAEAGDGWCVERYQATNATAVRVDVLCTWGAPGSASAPPTMRPVLVTPVGDIPLEVAAARRLLDRAYHPGLVEAPVWRTASAWLAEHVHDMDPAEARQLAVLLGQALETVAGQDALRGVLGEAMDRDGFDPRASLTPGALD